MLGKFPRRVCCVLVLIQQEELLSKSARLCEARNSLRSRTGGRHRPCLTQASYESGRAPHPESAKAGRTTHGSTDVNPANQKFSKLCARLEDAELASSSISHGERNTACLWLCAPCRHGRNRTLLTQLVVRWMYLSDASVQIDPTKSEIPGAVAETTHNLLFAFAGLAHPHSQQRKDTEPSFTEEWCC